jgi:protein gp37
VLRRIDDGVQTPDIIQSLKAALVSMVLKAAFKFVLVRQIVAGTEKKRPPMRQEWVLNIKRQCEEQRSAFFFKQWGGWGADGTKRAKKLNGRLLQGRTWDAVPALAVKAECKV